MKRTKALTCYLFGAIGQILLVAVAVYLFRSRGLIVDYSSTLGFAAIAIGGTSSALWGIIMSVRYRKVTCKTVLFDFFRIKQSYKNYLLAFFFLMLDFLPVVFGGEITITSWYLPIILFLEYIAFGGIEEIGWRYFFQPVLQERINYVLATILTFASWGTWHFLYFFIDGSIANIEVLPFLIGLLTNSFILSALYTKTKNLWLCVMTHSLINICSQFLVGGNIYVGYACKVIIIAMAILTVVRDPKRNCQAENDI